MARTAMMRAWLLGCHIALCAYVSSQVTTLTLLLNGAIEPDSHHDDDADSTKGFKTFAPVPAKSAALRVTTVRS